MKTIYNQLPVLLVLLLICVTFSCSLQKRQHLPGYHVEWKHNRVEKSLKENTELNSIQHIGKTNVVSDEKTSFTASNNEAVDVAASSQIQTFAKKLASHLLSRNKDSCDIIITRDWEFINAKVIEIGVDVIKYKKCSHLDGPLISIPKSSVAVIQYPNGDKNVFEKDEQREYVDNHETKPKRKFDPFGLIGFLLSLTSIPFWWLVSALIGLVGGVLGIVFGIISIARVARNRDKRSGLGFGIVSLIVGILLIVLTLVLWAAAGFI